jgi:signal transduction histidine kinase
MDSVEPPARGQPALKRDAEVATEIVLAQSAEVFAAEAEAKRRSWNGNAIMTVIAALLILIPSTSSFALRFLVVTLGWLIFELACIAYVRLGHASRVYLALDTLDEATQQLVLLTLIYLSDVVLPSPLWLMMFLLALGWLPKTPSRTRRSMIFFITGHAGLVAAFAASGQTSNASTALMMALSGALWLAITSQILSQGLRLRAERDLIRTQLASETIKRDQDLVARDLHDGVAADLVALLWRLHQSGTPEITQRAQRALEALRRAVQVLRKGQLPTDARADGEQEQT